MKYRLVCVIDINAPNKGVDVEICYETGTKNLSPFQRKVEVNDLIKSDVFSIDSLAGFVFLTGQTKQPFSFSTEQLQNQKLRDIINNNPWLYVKSGGKNSTLKRVASYSGFFSFSKKQDFEEGSLLFGELYISEIKYWWKNIKVRFRYKDSVDVFPVIYSDIPFLTENNMWFKRNRREEQNLLWPIESLIDNNESVLRLKENSFDLLKSLISSGWRLFVPKGNKHHSQVYLKAESSGIEWFSSSDTDSKDIITEKILDAYLHNRSYIESNDIVTVFSKQKVQSLSPNDITKKLIGELDADKLYSRLPNLTLDELDRIESSLKLGVKASLKPYQVEGILWLYQMKKKGTGCLLADDMGLGKTLQVLSYIAITININSNCLVICPASLTSNWENEIIKFTPQLAPIIKIVSYESIRLHIASFKSICYDTIIIDEGQFIKNDNTQRYKAINELNYKHMIMLSGTPIENSVNEIWSQFKLLIPEIETIFNKMKTYDIHGDNRRWTELSKVFLSPFILRRTKAEVLKKLPRKSEENIYLTLSEEEFSVYNSLRKMFVNAIETGVSGRINSIALEGLLRLRQCCVSLNLLPKNLTLKGYVRSTKMEFVIQMIKDFINEGHKILIFSQFTSALDELKRLLISESIIPLLLTGNTRNRQSLINTFQNDFQSKVFLISLKAGGTGLNLTAADRVILLDNWWNPAVEEQAFARAHRMGQTNEVRVYRIICKNTIEEKILELHINKKEISDIFNTVDDKLSIDQIKKLIV